MGHRILGYSGVAAVAATVVSLAGVSIAGQTPSGTQAKTTAAARPFAVAHTPDGQPDLQGVWSFAVGIPLERPGKFGEKPAVDEETGEAIELKKAAIERNVGKDSREGAGTE